MKTRGEKVIITTYDGVNWQGELKALVNGTGYEIKVNQALTLCL